MNDKVLELIIRAIDDGASATIARVSSVVSDLDAKTAAAAAKVSSFGDNMETAGKKLTSVGNAFLPFSVAAGAGLGLATKLAIDFNQQMEYLHTQAGLSQADVEGLKDKVLALAPAVGAGPDKLAEAFYHIASAGNGIWSTAQMLDMLKLSAEGAAVGNASLDETTYSLTSTMASNIKGAQSATEAMGNLNAIVGAGDMRFQDLNGAISTGIMATAATFGVDIRSMGTALATLTDNGEHADEASTRLRMTLSLMASPTTKAASLLADLGMAGPQVTAATDAMTEAFQRAHLTTTTMSEDLRQPNGIMVALDDLKTHLQASGLSADAANALLSKAFGGGRTDAAMLTMLQNLDRMDAKFKIIGQNAGKFADSWAAQQETAKQKMDDFRASVDVAAVKLGNAFLPELEKVAKKLGDLADWYSKLSPGTQDMIAKTLLFTAVLAPLFILIGSIATGIGAIITVATAMGPAFALAGSIVAGVMNGMLGGAGAARAAVIGLQMAISTPVALVIGIAAALAAIGYVFSKVMETRSAIEGVQQSYSQFSAVSSGLAAAAAKLPAGAQRTKMLALANEAAPTLDPITSFIAGLGHFAGGTNSAPGGLAVVGEQGPEIVNLPRGAQVIPADKSKKMMGGVTINQTNNIFNQVDMTAANRDLGWRLQNA